VGVGNGEEASLGSLRVCVCVCVCSPPSSPLTSMTVQAPPPPPLAPSGPGDDGIESIDRSTGRSSWIELPVVDLLVVVGGVGVECWSGQARLVADDDVSERASLASTDCHTRLLTPSNRNQNADLHHTRLHQHVLLTHTLDRAAQGAPLIGTGSIDFNDANLPPTVTLLDSTRVLTHSAPNPSTATQEPSPSSMETAAPPPPQRPPQSDGDAAERAVIQDAMDRLIECCERDLWPPPAAARLLGLYSRERNVEEARYA
jgi:hypothetical protein